MNIFKPVLLIVLFSFLACSEYTDNQPLVKSQKAIHYEYTSGVRDTVGIIYSEAKFDSAGNTIELIYYQDGIITTTIITKFDSNNNKVEEVYYNTPGIPSYRVVYSNNSDGNNTEIKYLLDEDPSEIAVLLYKGLIIKKGYDSQGRLFKEKRYKDGRPLDYTTSYYYDSFGRKSKSVDETLDLIFNTTNYDETIFTYSEQGNLKKTTKKNSDGSITYVYDKNGNLIETSSYDIDNNLKSKLIQEFNTDTKLISRTVYDGNGEPTSYLEYSYEYY